MLVQRGEDFEPAQRGRSAARTAEPFLDRGPRRKASRLDAQQLGHVNAGLSSSPGQACIHLVVEVSNLHSFRHPPTLACRLHRLMQSRMSRAMPAPLPGTRIGVARSPRTGMVALWGGGPDQRVDGKVELVRPADSGRGRHQLGQLEDGKASVVR